VTDPRDVFKSLLADAPYEPGRAYRAFYGPVELSLRVFVDGLTRTPGVQLDVPVTAVPQGATLPKMRGANISAAAIGEAGNLVRYEIVSADRVFSAVFVELAARLVEDARVAETAAAAIRTVFGSLHAWVRFFEARGREGLSRAAQLGLLGELLCLRDLGRAVPLQVMLRAWVGPAGGTHDFEAPAGAVEVKLSTSSAPERFRITSERQLDDSVPLELFVCAIRAQETATGGLSLPVLVKELAEHATREGGESVALLNDKLSDAGYSAADEPQYDVSVSVRNLDYVRVHGSFPRILPSELRLGVFSVSYEVPWNAIAPFRVDPRDVLRIFDVAE
jgi:hypothetical protein